MQLEKQYKEHGLTNIFDAISLWETAINYLEKATRGDLGDFTDAGKLRNAGDKNYTLYWKWFQELTGSDWQGQPYCAGAGSTMFASAFGLAKAKQLLCGKLHIYCPDVYNAFKKVGRVFSTPQIGDIVLFWSDSLGRWSHFGIVTGMPSGQYVTWEANTSSGNDVVIRNGGATCRKSYTLGARKVCFCRPDYASCGISTEKKDDTVKTYGVKTGASGVLVLQDMTVRKSPSLSGQKCGCIRQGTRVFPTKKAFDDTGRRWFYLPDLEGWCSTLNMMGWIAEEEAGGRWWYLLDNNAWYSGEIAVIDGAPYAFGDDGYMSTDEISAVPDENGVLRLKTKSEIIK